jgi:uncharacterized protein Yka (UPF0111/DUF47 family)
MRFRFLPREFNFFDLFDRQADNAVEAAVLFSDLTSKGAVSEAALAAMEEIEHRGDDATHSIIENLNKTFITPFDREDIHKLAMGLDDVIDMINTIVSRMRIYKLTGVNMNLVAFSALIEESVRGVACAVKGLRNLKNAKSIMNSCVEINRLENAGDRMRDTVLANLFETEKDPITVIKLKEIYQDAETVLDVCEDVANVVESILVKQA